MDTPARVRKHFDEDSARFDAIYSDEKPAHQRFVDRYVRGIVAERLRLARVLAPIPGDWSVLDVGCGSGRFDIALVKDGAARALGIDFAPKMIEIARRGAEAAGIADRCTFEVAEFMDFRPAVPFDIVLAIGYFDYVTDAEAHLRKMLEHSRVRVFASFPKLVEWRVPVRMLRFALSGGFVRFYTRGELEQILARLDLRPERAAILDLGRDYLLIARS
ncbi:MAG: class I SAM-dependent methyltransferase [Candidatus Eisenbacteria bacterium]